MPFDKTQDNFHSAEIAVFPFDFLGSKTPSVKKTAARTVKTAKTLDLNPRVGVGKTLGGWTEGSVRRKVDSEDQASRASGCGAPLPNWFCCEEERPACGEPAGSDCL